MTNTTTIGYVAFLLIAGSLVGVTVAQASEVTGTLSSNATSTTEASGNIGGTVTSASSGGGSGGGRGSSSGGRSNRSNGSDDSQPVGAVLGAATDTVSPGFPNAGFAPAEAEPVPTLWSRMVTFISTIVSS